MDDGLKRLGHSIRAFRVRNGISQDVLADKSELHRSYIGSVERGERNICFKNLEKIASAMEISIHEILKNADL